MIYPLVKRLLLARRYLLKRFVPAFVWPAQVLIDDVPINVRKTPYSFATKLLLVSGNYEAPERKLLQGIVHPGDTIIELGGSIGVLTAVIGKLTGAQGRVYSVEASARLTAFSRPWLEARGNIEVLTGIAFPVYICNHVTIDSFDETAGDLAGVVAFREDAAVMPSTAAATTSYDLKTIMETFHILPQILVVDIEGSERALLFHEARLPDCLQIVLIELHPAIYGRQVGEDIIKRILSLGFFLQAREADVCLFQRTKMAAGYAKYPIGF